MSSSAVRSVASKAARAPAHGKVALLAAVLLLLMTAVSLVGFLGLRDVNGDLRGITDNSGPAEQSLGVTAENIAHAQLELEQSTVLVGDTVDLSKLDAFDARLADAADGWTRFQSLATVGGSIGVDTTTFEEAERRGASGRSRTATSWRAARRRRPRPNSSSGPGSRPCMTRSKISPSSTTT